MTVLATTTVLWLVSRGVGAGAFSSASPVAAFSVRLPPSSSFFSMAAVTTTSAKTTTTTTVNDDENPPPVLLDPEIVSSRVFEKDSRPVVLFDGVCNMCNSAVNLALDWDPKGKLRFAALQSAVGRSLLQANAKKTPDDISSIVLVDGDGTAKTKSDAVLGIAEKLSPPLFSPLAKLGAKSGEMFVPKLLRDAVYDNVAENRYSFMGKRDACRCGDDDDAAAFRDRFVKDSIAYLDMNKIK